MRPPVGLATAATLTLTAVLWDIRPPLDELPPITPISMRELLAYAYSAV